MIDHVYTTSEMIYELRKMADQILTPSSRGKDLFGQIADRLHSLETSKASIHAALGLIKPLGNQTVPSSKAIQEAIHILERA